jgi:glycosyltransferase involved in cell wall biosynthesis
VFPSKVDTFGITILESMACGTPVAGYPVTGPIDQIVNGVNGYVSEDLERAVMKCLTIDREQTAESVKHITWKESAKQFATYVSS